MEIIGIIAGFLELIALYLVGVKVKYGFICGLIGNILWISFCIITNSSYGLLVVCPVALFLNSKGFSKWRRDEKTTNPHINTLKK